MGLVKIPHRGIMRFRLIGAVTVLDNAWKCRALHAGQFVGYGGFIKTLGTGAGTQTIMQVRNETMTTDMDYFATRPEFDVDAGSQLPQDGVFITNPFFRKDDIVCLDVDELCGGANSANAEFWLECEYEKEVEV